MVYRNLCKKRKKKGDKAAVSYSKERNSHIYRTCVTIKSTPWVSFYCVVLFFSVPSIYIQCNRASILQTILQYTKYVKIE